MIPHLRQQANALFDSVAAGMGAVERSAVLSDCGLYRYRLDRVWDRDKPVVCWCMLNPSTADATTDDPTIRRCMGFARAWGAGGIRVVNLFALRATDPAALYRHPSPIAPSGDAGEHPLYASVNDAHIVFASDGCRLIAAWGAHEGFMGRGRAVMRILANRRVECLGVTATGQPRHPLYLPADAEPLPFSIHGGTR